MHSFNKPFAIHLGSKYLFNLAELTSPILKYHRTARRFFNQSGYQDRNLSSGEGNVKVFVSERYYQ